jgi:uncharacterized coiled-coil protein SlyX
LAKLIKILAASVGGGVVLGVGIRLGEAIAAQIPVSGVEHGHRLAARLGDLENRLLSLEAGSPAAGSPIDRPESAVQSEVVQAESGKRAGVSAELTQLDSEGRQIDVGQTTQQLRGELRDWLAESVTVRMAEVETRLRTEFESGPKQMLDAFAESVQTRVVHRISRLEEEVAGQSAAMSELRECSLRTERSVHKLLGGLDRLIVKSPAAAEEAGEAVNQAPANAGSITLPAIESAEIAPAESGPPPADGAAPPSGSEPPPVIEPPAFEAPRKSRRWRIFG